MKDSKLQKFAWVFFALALTTTTVFAQGWRNGNRVNSGQNNLCLQQISGLTEDQKSSIEQLNSEHQSAMVDLRRERRSTTDIDKKNDIRDEMLEMVQAHRDEVKSFLTEEQRSEYELLQARNSNFRGKGYRQGGRQGKSMNRQGNKGWRGNRGRNYNQPGCMYYNSDDSKK